MMLRNKKPEESVAVFAVRYRHGNVVTSLLVNYIYYNAQAKSTHLHVIPQQSAKAQQTYADRQTRKAIGLFVAPNRHLLSSRNVLT